jgi:hypothetical protein
MKKEAILEWFLFNYQRITHMAILRHIILVVLGMFQVFSLAQSGMTGILINEQEGIKANPNDFIYDMELMPGQEFSGYIYHWSLGDESWAELTEEPEVEWLEISPSEFVSYGCEEPVPVKFTFKAPQEIGEYTTTVEDWWYNWPDNIITLKVTEHPTYKLADTMIVFQGPDTNSTRYQYHEYHGIDPKQSWFDDGYCGDTPYIVNPQRKITHMIYPLTKIVSVEPNSFTLDLEMEQTVTKIIGSNEVYLDSFYEAVSKQWLSYPKFIKWKIVREDLMPIPEPEPEPVPPMTARVYPNPFQEFTGIYVDVPYISKVTLQLFDYTGRMIGTIAEVFLFEESYKFEVNLENLPEGLYLCRIETERETKVIKLVDVKD